MLPKSKGQGSQSGGLSIEAKAHEINDFGPEGGNGPRGEKTSETRANRFAGGVERQVVQVSLTRLMLLKCQCMSGRADRCNRRMKSGKRKPRLRRLSDNSKGEDGKIRKKANMKKRRGQEWVKEAKGKRA